MRLSILTILGLFLFGIHSNAQMADGSTVPDFTSTDINGNTHALYADYLNQGKPVVIDVSATWCGPCWSYHNTHALKDLYTVYGPAGSDEMGVLFVEGDGSTNQADLEGTGNSTAGDWVTGTPYPILDDAAVSNLLQISYYPTIYGVCPDGKIYEFGQENASSLVNLFATTCGVNLQGAVDNAAVEDHISEICIAGESVIPSIDIHNFGTNNLTSLTLELFEAGNPVAIETINWEGNIMSLGSTTVSFSAIDNISDQTVYTVISSMPNGVEDAYNYANEGEISIEFAPFTTENTIKVIITTDNYPGETSWNLKDGNGTILESFGPYTAGTDDQWGAGGPDANQTFEYPVALPLGVDCYSLNVFDSFGDGMSLSSSAAGYAVTTANGDIINEMSKPNFGDAVNESFGADSDGNGSTGISELSTVSTSVYPNPIRSKATLSVNLLESSNARLDVVNMLGETIMSENYSLNSGNNLINLNVNTLSNGVYFTHLIINDEVITNKITVTK